MSTSQTTELSSLATDHRTGATSSTSELAFSNSVLERLEQLQRDQVELVRNQRKTKKWKIRVAVITLVVLFGTCFSTIIIVALQPKYQITNVPNTEKSASSPLLEALPVNKVLGVSSDQSQNAPEPLRKYYFNVGMRNDYLLQECQGPYLKRSFPDMDYALLGYNILKGFPLSVGHDPGFTLPIFAADYRAGRQTADCRYSVPKGIILIPDVSCITSFSSEVVETKYAFSKSLAVSASVSGGGWGAQFSASAGYKESSSVVSTGESVFILSKASCNYYYMRLLEDDAPPFDPLFLDWIIKLNNTNNETVYVTFFERYGTHFLKEVKFGATFTYEHKMSSSSYKSEQDKGVNVAVSASYSGLFSVGASFSMDSDQKQAASDFRKNVETKTITIGAAPPANGDALTWASMVKESPVPVTYVLASMEELFTETFMDRLGVANKVIAYDAISKRIVENKQKYCIVLQSQGLIDDCAALSPGISMKKTRLFNYYTKTKASTIGHCIDKCYKTNKCVAVTHCIDCKKNTEGYDTCYMYNEIGSNYTQCNLVKVNTCIHLTARERANWESVIVVSKIQQQVVFHNTTINGVERSLNTSARVTTVQACFAACLKDLYCAAFTFCECPDRDKKCTLYSDAKLSLYEEIGTSTHFIPRHVANVDEVYPFKEKE